MNEFVPTDERRRVVRALSGLGLPQDDIATHLGIDPKTLRKHFRTELDLGAIEATAKVAQSLFRMATDGNNVGAAIFWMKARAGWREVNRQEHTGPDGGPIRVQQQIEDTRPPIEGMILDCLDMMSQASAPSASGYKPPPLALQTATIGTA